MNIFVLDNDPLLAAHFHCDQHVVKMTLETAQLLSTEAWRIGMWDNGLYLPTHAKHPCTLWLADNPSAIYWMCRLGYALANEYSRRFNKTHKTEVVINNAIAAVGAYYEIGYKKVPPPFKFAQAMPEEFKNPESVVAYHQYYQHKYDSWKLDKRKAMRYTNTEPPYWLKT